MRPSVGKKFLLITKLGSHPFSTEIISLTRAAEMVAYSNADLELDSTEHALVAARNGDCFFARYGNRIIVVLEDTIPV